MIAWELAESSVKIRALWWTAPSQAEVLRVRHGVIAAIKERLEGAGIEMPFPTRVVLLHDRTEEAAADEDDRSRHRGEGSRGGTAAPGHSERSHAARPRVSPRTIEAATLHRPRR